MTRQKVFLTWCKRRHASTAPWPIQMAIEVNCPGSSLATALNSNGTIGRITAQEVFRFSKVDAYFLEADPIRIENTSLGRSIDVEPKTDDGSVMLQFRQDQVNHNRLTESKLGQGENFSTQLLLRAVTCVAGVNCLSQTSQDRTHLVIGYCDGRASREAGHERPYKRK